MVVRVRIFSESWIKRVRIWIIRRPTVEGFLEEVALLDSAMEREECAAERVRDVGLPPEEHTKVESFPCQLCAETIVDFRDVGIADCHDIVVINNTILVVIQVLDVTGSQIREVELGRAEVNLVLIGKIAKGDVAEFLVQWMTLGETPTVGLHLIAVNDVVAGEREVPVNAITYRTYVVVQFSCEFESLVVQDAHIRKRSLVQSSDSRNCVPLNQNVPAMFVEVVEIE